MAGPASSLDREADPDRCLHHRGTMGKYFSMYHQISSTTEEIYTYNMLFRCQSLAGV